MALASILSRLATTTGMALNVSSQRLFLRDQIVNVAARKMFLENELRNANREQIFNVGENQQQIVLPWYVDRVIGARDYDNRMPATQVDMRPRYQTSDWIGYSWTTWREKQREYPVSREMLNAGPLTITFGSSDFPVAVTSAYTVTITGKTANAQRVIETLTFAIGDSSKTTANSWEEIVSIQKTIYTNADLRVYDLDGEEIAFIANFAERSKYVLLQIIERFQNTSPSRLYETLYRPVYIPMVNDTDTFMCGEMYDDLIYLKCLEVWYSRRSDEAGIQLAVAAKTNYLDTLNNFDQGADDSKKMKLNMAPNVVLSAMDQIGYWTTPPYNSIYDAPRYW